MFDHELDALVLRRVVALKRFTLFEGVDLAELATLAQNVTETTLAPDQRVAADPNAMHFIFEGAIAVAGTEYVAGEIVGGLELLARRALTGDVRATKPTRTLRLNAEDLFDLLDDNFGLLRAAIRSVATLALAVPRSPVRRDSLALPGPLGLVERLLLLREQAPLARARIRALTTLARASQELAWPGGAVIVRPSDRATSSYVIAEGTVREGDGDAAPVLGKGDAFGLLETLAGRSHDAAFEAITPVRVLASPQDVLLDVLEDHADLGVAVLGALAGDVLSYSATRFARPNTRALTSSTTTR
ncbi:MAG TPA: cyclic nucleotide-binding domain-containing protein [Kofleriaceae bacterium]|nr:cyclic nucleotide-binding domain-containing protein [Kofleriaceae bacterium]